MEEAPLFFLADVHLRPDDRCRQERFLDVLHGTEGDVWILGDLFDVWSGPHHRDSGEYRIVLEGLADFTCAGRRVILLPGNRDYLIDRRFSAETGVRLETMRVELFLGGRRVRLSHGDDLFNRNPRYSAYRRMMRFDPIREAFLSVPAALKKILVGGFRKVSVLTTPGIDWTREDLLRRTKSVFDSGVDVILCGHIHRSVHLQGGKRELHVLGDWDTAPEGLVYEEGTFRRVSL